LNGKGSRKHGRRPGGKTRSKHRLWLYGGLGLAALAATLLVYLQSGMQGQGSQPSINIPMKEVSQGERGPYRGLYAPEFYAKSVDGLDVRLSDFKGKTVILWFMAAWCPSCASVASMIKGVVGDRSDIIVIVVDIWTEDVLKKAGLLNDPKTPPPENPIVLKGFIESYGGPRWILVMDDFGLSSLYQLRFVDSTFVIGPDGRVILRSDGPITPILLRNSLAG
jgi:thiol-disulfide isomerase/thioredoxin